MVVVEVVVVEVVVAEEERGCGKCSSRTWDLGYGGGEDRGSSLGQVSNSRFRNARHAHGGDIANDEDACT